MELQNTQEPFICFLTAMIWTPLLCNTHSAMMEWHPWNHIPDEYFEYDTEEFLVSLALLITKDKHLNVLWKAEGKVSIAL
jgi:hypothetical protein